MENLTALLRAAPSLPEERIAQEVALLAARSDVREELDRLASHIEAAHALLREALNIGRRFDFLVQEFNREANTLCSKSASVALTATGLQTEGDDRAIARAGAEHRMIPIARRRCVPGAVGAIRCRQDSDRRSAAGERIGLAASVSVTTRAPRHGEVEGVTLLFS